MKFNFEDHNAIITHVPTKGDKVHVALIKNGQHYDEIAFMSKANMKWNPDNIRFIWDYDTLTTFRELYDMLKILSFEYILSEWNQTFNERDNEIENFNVECTFDQTYVDEDLDYFLRSLEKKGIDIQYNYENRCIRFVDIDGSIFEANTKAFTNRHDDDLESEIIVFWDTLKEI